MKKFFWLLITLSSFTSFINAQNGSTYWSLAGNNNATASSRLGTTNNISLRFYTNDVQRMIINSAQGYVGIGTGSPVNILTVQSSGGTPATSWLNGLNSPVYIGFAQGVSSEFVLAAANSMSTRRAVIQGRRSRGTLDAPTKVANNDYLTSVVASGYDGNTFQNAAAIDFFVDGTPSSGHVPARISFVTGTNATDRVERLKVGSSGDFNFNNTQLFIQASTGNVGLGTILPSDKLHVAGKGRFTNGLSVDDSGIYSYFAAGNGVEGYSDTCYGSGIFGSGYYGVYGRSANYGVYGYCEGANYGVYGKSDYNGVFGLGTNYGVIGSGKIGVYGGGPEYGLYAYSGGTGLYAFSEGVPSGTNGQGSYAGYFLSNNYRGIYVSSNGTGHYAGYFAGDIYTSGTLYQSSDGRIKKDIKEVTNAMDIIKQLQPKNYEFRNDGSYAGLALPKGRHYGLIAQELEKVLPDLVKEEKHTFNTVDNSIHEQIKLAAEGKLNTKETTQVKQESIDVKAVNYVELIPILIKAMQEQEAKIEALTNLVNKLSLNNSSSPAKPGGYLSQSIPNPASKTARINYEISTDFTKAELVIANMAGQKLKQLLLNKSGIIDIDTSKLSAGTYSYILVVDGATLGTKKMVIVR